MNGFDQLTSEAEQYLSLSLSANQVESLARFAEMLMEWNQKISLTAIRSADEIRIKHILDSLSCHLAMQHAPIGHVIDIGSGAGFPGIPLKILYPEMRLSLVESVNKKTQFLSHVVQELGLSEVEILTERAEVIGQQDAHRAHYDWAAARAVARLPVLAEYLLPLVKVGGYMLAQKGESAPSELTQAQTALEQLGGEVVKSIPVKLPGDLPGRYLVLIQKVRPTPDKFPRRAGIPGKRPLGN
ncbi:MAG: 16S rRNA (guanine(527)-N(7))-methyltransferase RsmG [Chloroflexota bacterium]